MMSTRRALILCALTCAVFGAIAPRLVVGLGALPIALGVACVLTRSLQKEIA